MPRKILTLLHIIKVRIIKSSLKEKSPLTWSESDTAWFK